MPLSNFLRSQDVVQQILAANNYTLAKPSYYEAIKLHEITQKVSFLQNADISKKFC